MVAKSNTAGGDLISFRDQGLRSFLCLSPRDFDARTIVEEALQKSLARPLQDFYERPRKEFRARLVRVGYRLFANAKSDAAIANAKSDATVANAKSDATISHGNQEANVAEVNPDAPTANPQNPALDLACEAIEALHTGSLIVDDIEDGSEWRRGGPTLHQTYGIPTALNAGNWLYFFGFERLKNIHFEGPDAAARRWMLFDLAESVLREAHCGQALDVGTDMADLEAKDAVEISRASLELKSGALMGLALGLGAIIAGVDEQKLRAIVARGLDFGVSLQMFDDLGNARVDRPTPKHLEDLRLRRPSFLWWHCAEKIPYELPALKAAARELPHTDSLDAFFKRTGLLESGFAAARDYQQRALLRFESELQPHAEAFQELKAIAERVSHAYS